MGGLVCFSMVKTYKRKTNRGEWAEESMEKAVKAVLEEKMGYMLAAKTFSVPQTTLERKVKKARENLALSPSKSIKVKVSLGPKQPVFTEKEEDELCGYILDMETRLYGLTAKDLRALAYNLAVKNNKVHPFNVQKQEAGKDWFQGFLNRHPDLSIRKPESTSAARAAGFNRIVVDNFFNFLGNIYDEHHLTPDRIYNCDETGVSVVPKTKSKIIAKRGRKQVGALTSAERGTTITVEICFSASGQYMPPMMVFPRKRMDPQLMLNAAPGAWGVVSDSGWMTTELFLGWFKQFVKFSGATVDRPVLLLLDGHSTHTKNIDLINEARANGVIILCFPPHTTHRLQVADVVYMRPLSNYYDRQITTWLRSNPGMVVTMRQVAEIFGKAFIETSTMATAVNGFKKCGIWPYDPTVFSETDFAPSLVTDIPLTQTLTSATTNVAVTAPAELETQQVDVLPVLDTSEAAITNATTSRASLLSTGVETEAIRKTINNVPVSATFHETPTVTSATSSSPQPGCSTWVDDTEIDRRPTTPQQSTFSVVSPQQILPLPASRRKSIA